MPGELSGSTYIAINKPSGSSATKINESFENKEVDTSSSANIIESNGGIGKELNLNGHAHGENKMKNGELHPAKSVKDEKEKDKEIPMKFLDIKILINGVSDPVVVQLTNHDTVQDIRQVILEKPECCYRTCFSLCLGTTRLDDFMELHDIPNLNDESVIKVVDEPYSIREARIHIRRLRDLLVSDLEPNAFTATDNLSLSYCSAITQMDVEEEAWKYVKDPPSQSKIANYLTPPSYAMLHQSGQPKLEPLIIRDKEVLVPPCLIDLKYSAWNPPPGYRKLAGDLLYLEVTILEDPANIIHITSSSNGFFVNKTTKGLYDPRPNNEAHRCQTLAGLLSILSPSFKKNFSIIQRTSIKKHPLELVASPHQVFPWLAPKFEHSQDPFRAEDAITNRIGYEEQIPGQLRDWNEELQSAKELPKETRHLRILRDRALYKITCDFVSAATRGAIAVVDGNVMAINPGEEEKMRMYIWNNLFFSFACDSREHYQKYGGDDAAYVAASLDLKGVEMYNKLDLEGLYTLGTVVVDYRGYRIIAQSIIPGILQREQENSVVYGSVDGGKTISTHDMFLEKLKIAGLSMKIRPHKVVNEKEEDIELCSSIECKGIIGADGRHYILDLFRTFPPDVNFLSVPKINRLLINGEFVEGDNAQSKTSSEFKYPIPHSQQLVSVQPAALEAFIGYKYVSFVKVIAIHKLQDENVKGEKNMQEKKSKKDNASSVNTCNKQRNLNKTEDSRIDSCNNLNKESCDNSVDDVTKILIGKYSGENDNRNSVKNGDKLDSVDLTVQAVSEIKICNESEKDSDELAENVNNNLHESINTSTEKNISEHCEVITNSISVNDSNVSMESAIVISDIKNSILMDSTETFKNYYVETSISNDTHIKTELNKSLEITPQQDPYTVSSIGNRIDDSTLKDSTETSSEKEKNEEDLSDIKAVEAAAKAVGSLSDREFDIRFNPDAHVREVTLSKSEEKMDKLDKALIEDIAVFISNTIIPKMIDDFASLTASPIDGIALTEIMHSRGINMRYLGKIAYLCAEKKNLEHAYTIVVKEMVLRSAKKLFKGCMQSANQRCLSSAISHFLNCFLGSLLLPHANIPTEETNKKKKNKKKSQKLPHLPSNNNVMWMSLSPHLLWISIDSHIQNHFGYKIECTTVDNLVEMYNVQKLSLLREFSKKTGIQILHREYEFDDKKNVAFFDEDILNIFPIVKCVTPKATDASIIFAAAQARLQSGFFGEAHELMIEALNMFNQVYGPLHPDIVICYRAIARIHYLADDAVQAVAFQKKAVIVAERIFGIDHPETLVAYVHLALYCYHGGIVNASLRLMYRSRYLALLAFGEDHPDMATFDTNIGLMLYNQREFNLACKFLEHSRNLQVKYHGTNSLHTATGHHLVARVLTALGNYKAALNSEKTTYGIYQKHFGVEDVRTKESSEALKTILNQAVMLQKTLKDIAERGCVNPTKVTNLDDINFDKKILTMVNKIEEVDENGEPVKIPSQPNPKSKLKMKP